MSDWIALAIIAGALYAIECVAWIHGAHWVCFRAPVGGTWRASRGSRLPGNDRGGLVLRDPLRVSAGLVICRNWPFSISPDGLANRPPADAIVDRPPTPACIAWDDIRTVNAELDEVVINGRRFVRVESSIVADHFVDLIDRIRRRARSNRAAEITAAIRAALRTGDADARWTSFLGTTRALRALCAALQIYTFVACPIVLFVVGPHPSWKYLLAALMTLTLSVAVACFRAHAALFPNCKYDRWVHSLSMLLLPVAAIRSIDKLSRDVLCAYSFAVVGPMLCGTKASVPLLREHLIDLGRSIDTDARSDETNRCIAWFRARLAEETLAALDALHVDVMAPPVRDDAMRFYCPRCHAQFGNVANPRCSECPAIELVPFRKKGKRRNAEGKRKRQKVKRDGLGRAA